MTPEKLCVEKASKLLQFATEVFSYEFSEEPNYTKLKFLLSKVLLDHSVIPNTNMDWSRHPITPVKRTPDTDPLFGGQENIWANDPTHSQVDRIIQSHTAKTK